MIFLLSNKILDVNDYKKTFLKRLKQTLMETENGYKYKSINFYCENLFILKFFLYLFILFIQNVNKK